MANNNNGTGLLSLVTGIAIGALAGVLFAPDKGKNTRSKLSYQLDKYKEQLEEMIEELTDAKEPIVSGAKTEGQKVVADAVKHAQQLMNEVEALKKQVTNVTADKGTEKN